MRKRIALFLLALAAFAPPALADEGSPLLSVDDLLALEDSYEAFLAELGDLAVERGLLSEEDRAAWHDAHPPSSHLTVAVSPECPASTDGN